MKNICLILILIFILLKWHKCSKRHQILIPPEKNTQEASQPMSTFVFYNHARFYIIVFDCSPTQHTKKVRRFPHNCDLLKKLAINDFGTSFWLRKLRGFWNYVIIFFCRYCCEVWVFVVYDLITRLFPSINFTSDMWSWGNWWRVFAIDQNV